MGFCENLIVKISTKAKEILVDLDDLVTRLSNRVEFAREALELFKDSSDLRSV